jgi:hypothetical protein
MGSDPIFRITSGQTPAGGVTGQASEGSDDRKAPVPLERLLK